MDENNRHQILNRPIVLHKRRHSRSGYTVSEIRSLFAVHLKPSIYWSRGKPLV